MSPKAERISRRHFLAVGSGLLGSLAAFSGCAKKQPGKVLVEFPEDAPYAGFRMGVQSWCFREKTTDELIAGLHSLKLAHVEIVPNLHLPMDQPPEAVKAAVQRFHDEGITIDAFGVERVANDEATCRKLFEYAKATGVLAISVSPAKEAIGLLDRLTAEYGIPVAIHNHGPGAPWATPEEFREGLAGASTRVGLCVDLGHFNRSGVDPLAVIDEFADRIHGIHLKDLVKNESGEWVDVVVGRGAVNLPVLMSKLKKMNFKGYFSLEYESDPGNPLPPLGQCLEELRSACAGLA